ncbi:MAG: tRNA (adenine-N1)-methyltransferase [Anaerolineales bacterium]|nr:tRNA (adenine-N1)-methyltransferase [Anaerolineales bacterium]
MSYEQYTSTAKEGDLAQLLDTQDRTYIVKIQVGARIHTHNGFIAHDDLIGVQWGTKVTSHLGKPYLILQPALDDILRNIHRNTQILYPKDIGYIILNMGIGPGKTVVEAGTGSGALTIALAHAVGTEGHVHTFEKREDMSYLAQGNLKRIGMEDRVSFYIQDIAEGFPLRDIYALFLDVQDPENYIHHVRECLMPGGFFGCILPTTNQVSRLLSVLDENEFSFIEISEILRREYKPVAARLRPFDRMIAHTGYLMFARKVSEVIRSKKTSRTYLQMESEETR